MEKKEISMQLYTTRHFQPYDTVLKFLSDSGNSKIDLMRKNRKIFYEIHYQAIKHKLTRSSDFKVGPHFIPIGFSIPLQNST